MERIPGVTVSRAGGLADRHRRDFDRRRLDANHRARIWSAVQSNPVRRPRSADRARQLGRGFDFGSVGSDFVGQVDVMKTPDATLSSGAIGATINIKYPKPFDHPGLQLAGSVSGNESSGENKIKPSAGLLFSDTFADDRFGILADVAYADSKSAVITSIFKVGKAETRPGAVVWRPASWPAPHPVPMPRLRVHRPASPPVRRPRPASRIGSSRTTASIRNTPTTSASAAGWCCRPGPWTAWRSLSTTIIRKETLVQDQYGFSVWFNGNGLTNVTQAPDGTVMNFTQPGTPTDFQAQINQVGDYHQYGRFNVKWDATAHNVLHVRRLYRPLPSSIPTVNTGWTRTSAMAMVPTPPRSALWFPAAKSSALPERYGPAGDTAHFVNPTYHWFARVGGDLQPEYEHHQPVQAGRRLARRSIEVQVRRASALTTMRRCAHLPTCPTPGRCMRATGRRRSAPAASHRYRRT